jgi:single-strand DNA-binding protein
VNRIVLVGRLENTPEIRFTSSGIPVSNFSLSVRRSHPNSEGIWERDTFRIVTWRKLAETCCKYLEKGRWIAVDGKLQNRYINTSNNERRVMVEIHADDIRFLDFRMNQRERETERKDFEAKPVARESRSTNGEKQEFTREVYESEPVEVPLEVPDEREDSYQHYLQDEEGTPLDLSDV